MRVAVGALALWARAWRAGKPAARCWPAARPTSTAPLVPPPPPSLPPGRAAADRRRSGWRWRRPKRRSPRPVLEAGRLASVFASSNGDGAVIDAILEALAGPAPGGLADPVPQLRPQQPAGLLVDRRRQPGASTSLGCWDDTFAAALLQAAAKASARGSRCCSAPTTCRAAAAGRGAADPLPFAMAMVADASGRRWSGRRAGGRLRCRRRVPGIGTRLRVAALARNPPRAPCGCSRRWRAGGTATVQLGLSRRLCTSRSRSRPCSTAPASLRLIPHGAGCACWTRSRLGRRLHPLPQPRPPRPGEPAAPRRAPARPCAWSSSACRRWRCTARWSAAARSRRASSPACARWRSRCEFADELPDDAWRSGRARSRRSGAATSTASTSAPAAGRVCSGQAVIMLPAPRMKRALVTGGSQPDRRRHLPAAGRRRAWP